MAELKCSSCSRDYYGDLPVGHGLYYPLLLERATGRVHNPTGVGFFASWLQESYAHRVGEAFALAVEQRRDIHRPVLLNALDPVYGHALTKLICAHHHLDLDPGLDLIVLVPRFLRWLVPANAAALWSVDLPADRLWEWSDGTAAEIRRRLEAWPEVELAATTPGILGRPIDPKRLTGLDPFPLDQWAQRLRERPTVTFWWREDRLWRGRRRWIHALWDRSLRRPHPSPGSKAWQTRRVRALAEALRVRFPRLDFGVVGFGQPRGLPAWVVDLRAEGAGEAAQAAWIERTARSHVVVGVLGSHMLLPSALAGSVVDLVPPAFLANQGDDLIIPPQPARQLLFRYRYLTADVSAITLAEVLAALLAKMPLALWNLGGDTAGLERIPQDPWAHSRVRAELVSKMRESTS
ncbi:MAG: hypothetical protein HYY13_11540 [Nitrospirae bacterium]|nr:hypothetical protein [Nitrospirota bacterium]